MTCDKHTGAGAGKEVEFFMAKKKLGKQTVALETPPTILAEAGIVGTKEGQGPLARWFDEILTDDMYGETSWEKAESKLQKSAIQKALDKAKLTTGDIDYIFAGDLLNQCAGSHYALKDINIPFWGLYGACSTMAESIAISALTLDGGYADYTVAVTSSHFCSAEKQYRYPLEYGGQRPPTAQWTVTGSGSCVLASCGGGPYVTHVTTGKIVDMGIKDANNMGAAMAPAAVDTIAAHFADTGRKPSDYDLIVSGDLASIGTQITKELLAAQGYDLSANYNDCGNMIFYTEAQDVHAGGSGCGCSGVVFCSYILERLRRGELNRVLFVGTGALMNPLSLLQNESIPCIAHAITVQRSLA